MPLIELQFFYFIVGQILVPYSISPKNNIALKILIPYSIPSFHFMFLETLLLDDWENAQSTASVCECLPNRKNGRSEAHTRSSLGAHLINVISRFLAGPWLRCVIDELITWDQEPLSHMLLVVYMDEQDRQVCSWPCTHIYGKTPVLCKLWDRVMEMEMEIW